MKKKVLTCLTMGCLRLIYSNQHSPLIVVHRKTTSARKVVQSFMSVDPLADSYPAWSPYHYTLNNPLRYTDPTGMAVEDEFTQRKDGSWYRSGSGGGENSHTFYHNEGSTTYMNKHSGGWGIQTVKGGEVTYSYNNIKTPFQKFKEKYFTPEYSTANTGEYLDFVGITYLTKSNAPGAGSNPAADGRGSSAIIDELLLPGNSTRSNVAASNLDKSRTLSEMARAKNLYSLDNLAKGFDKAVDFTKRFPPPREDFGMDTFYTDSIPYLRNTRYDSSRQQTVQSVMELKF